MSRSRSKQPTISLFAFQDIITSVTAILILLVLILSLELITRTAAKAARDPAATTRAMAAAVTDMELAIDALEADHARRLSLARQQPDPQEARTQRILLDQVERMRQQLSDSRAIEREAGRIADSTARDLRSAEQDAEVIAEELLDASKVAELAKAMSEANSQIRADIEAASKTPSQSAGAEVVFTRDTPSGSSPWLLDVAASGVAVVRLGTGKPERLGADVGIGSILERWITRLDRQHDHVLVLVRPSGVKMSGEVRQRLRDRGIPFGIDLIREDAIIRDGATKPGVDARAEDTP